MTQKKAEKKSTKSGKPKRAKMPEPMGFTEDFVKQMDAKTIARILNNQDEHLDSLLNPGPFSMNGTQLLYAMVDMVAMWMSMSIIIAPNPRLASLPPDNRRALAMNHLRDLLTYTRMPDARASDLLARLDRVMAILAEHGGTFRAAFDPSKRDKRPVQERMIEVLPTFLPHWMSLMEAMLGKTTAGPKKGRGKKKSEGTSSGKKRRPPVPGL